MSNVAKYFLLLETLKFVKQDSANDEKNINKNIATEDEKLREYNVNVLRKFLKQDTNELFKHLRRTLQLENVDSTEDINPNNTLHVDYIIQLQYVLMEIISNVNFGSDAKSDLISMRHTNLCIEALQDLAYYSLWQHLHAIFCRNGVFKGERLTHEKPNYELLKFSLAFFAHILQVKQLHMANSMKHVVRDYMAGIYTIYMAHYRKEYPLAESELKRLYAYLNYVWTDISKLHYYRNTMLMKGVAKLPIEINKMLHKQLLLKLVAKDGFATFLATMQLALQQQQHQAQQQQQKHATRDEDYFELVACIVAAKSNTQVFQQKILIQIFDFMETSLMHASASDAMTIGLRAATFTLRRFYELNAENQQQIEKIINERMRSLYAPEELLSGLLLMQNEQFSCLITLLFYLFCNSSVECLPSTLLANYLPLLLQLHFNIPETFKCRQQVATLITRYLNNSATLETNIQQLYTLQYNENWLQLHPRIVITPNESHTALIIKIGPPKAERDFSISLALPDVLMSQEHNNLTFRVFMILLEKLALMLQNEISRPNIDLLQTESELVEFLNTHYPVKVEILYTLNLLISHQALRAQLSEHAGIFVKFLRKFSKCRLQQKHNLEEMDQVLLMLLTVSQELLERSNLLPENFVNFATELQQLRHVTANKLLLERINVLLPVLRGEFNFAQAEAKNAFNMARELIETRESHLQVYGIQMLLDLLRRKDAVASVSGHVIVALALSTLKDRESYTFLNCVRLFVSLVHVMEAEVLELLCDEYTNEQAAVDYRLVVGETVLKVSQELGPLTYKYKDVLLNCFMHGARSSLDEFRMSSFANLALLCRTLTYQVHRFFHELLDLINCELSTGKYLPAKRAAVLVLSELLEGMDNLLDFEDMLLPLYRYLKTIESNEQSDDKMRLHAANGLKILNEKCRKLLFETQALEKEIKIMGIKDKPKVRTGYSKFILDLNINK